MFFSLKEHVFGRGEEKEVFKQHPSDSLTLYCHYHNTPTIYNKNDCSYIKDLFHELDIISDVRKVKVCEEEEEEEEFIYLIYIVFIKSGTWKWNEYRLYMV